jgi:putative YphP/YqiW family bacilliredoxin
MTYPEDVIAPLRAEMVALGFDELRTPEAVDRFMAESGDGVALLAVNSICGCAAGTMRPALARALSHPARPHRLGTVFAGHDVDATSRARGYFTGYAPSSPAVALYRRGELILMLERHHIKGQHPWLLAEQLAAAVRQALGDEAAA